MDALRGERFRRELAAAEVGARVSKGLDADEPARNDSGRVTWKFKGRARFVNDPSHRGIGDEADLRTCEAAWMPAKWEEPSGATPVNPWSKVFGARG